jgi:hypothetical protein
MITKNDILDLTKSQLQTIIKEIKNKLKLGITGKSKEELVSTIFNLHNKNKFYGKRLLSFDNSGHITLPERKIKEPNVKKIAEKKARKIKQMETDRIEKLNKSKLGKIELLQEKFKKLKNPSIGQIEALKAKLRAIKKM